MTTCLMNNQINDKRKMSILSEETLLESGKFFRKIAKAEVWTHVLQARLDVRTFGVYLKVRWHYTWNLKPKRWISSEFPQCLLFSARICFLWGRPRSLRRSRRPLCPEWRAKVREDVLVQRRNWCKSAMCGQRQKNLDRTGSDHGSDHGLDHGSWIGWCKIKLEI